MTDIVATMTEEQLRRAEAVGIAQHERRKDSPTTIEVPPKGMTLQSSRCCSVCAEYVIALLWNVPWDPDDHPNRKTGDVLGHEVRWSKDGILRLHKYDPPEQAVVCTYHIPPVVIVRGWLPAGEGQRKEWWNERLKNPCYEVPGDYPLRWLGDLHPLDPKDIMLGDQYDRHPPWRPRYDYGHWNERWGSDLPPVPPR